MHNVRTLVLVSGGVSGEVTMTVYSGPVFEMVVSQFNVIANHLGIPMDERPHPDAQAGGHGVLPDPPHRAFDHMLMRASTDKVPHRTAAMAIGVEKVRAAKNTRGLFP